MNTRTVDAGPVWAALSEEWPQFDWRAPRRVHGAFHVVGILGSSVVIRVNFGTRHRERCIDESTNVRAVGDLALPLEVPRVLCGPVHAPEWSAVALTVVSGVGHESMPWAEARKPLLATLDLFRGAVPVDGAAPLRPVRAWCGGDAWPDIVEQCAAGLGREHRRLAASVVDRVIRLEPVSRATFVHGDFGPHNLMFTGEDVAGVVDLDAATMGDPAIDIAPLLGLYPPNELERDFSHEVLQRARTYRATLPLQVAAAAFLTGDRSLREHALANFTRRADAGTLH